MTNAMSSGERSHLCSCNGVGIGQPPTLQNMLHANSRCKLTQCSGKCTQPLIWHSLLLDLGMHSE